MHKFLPLALLLACLPPTSGLGQAEPVPVIAHSIEARLDPDAGEIQVQDRLTLPEGRETWDLVLHRDLSPRVVAGEASLELVARDGHLDLLQLTRHAPGPVTLAYGGPIRHGLTSTTEGMGRERQSSAGTIGPEGVFLDGGSGWYPRVPGSLQTFDLQVTLPDGWHAISQGAGPDRDGQAGSAWSETQPQDDIYLIAAPFTLYREPGPGFEAQVWLRRPDPDLANRYLAATRDSVDLYGGLIGPYPYAKFALVENFWETGYGMPSFTLLGPQVIRLPFIINTSYPHEVLHNWWGNGVYVDYQSGNWSEGLTAYLADHLMKEREGQGADYRRDSLKSYGDYVRGAEDLPLTAFRARHGTASQAIGYSKSAMVFHMLRRRLGDELFLQGLGRFYQDNRFRTAAWADLRKAFESVSGQDLGAFFAAWTTRSGAPRLTLADVQVERQGNGFRVTGRLEQGQRQAAFPLRVPLVVHQEQGPPVELMVDLGERSSAFGIDLASAPVRLAVDPAFDTFRELLPGESPAALSNLFGAEKGLILLPEQATPDLLDGYRALAEAWAKGHPGWRVTTDAGVRRLPKDGAIWVLGWENRFAPELARDARGFELRPPDGCAAAGGAGLWSVRYQPGAHPRDRRSALGLGRRVPARVPPGTGPQAAPLRQVRLPGLLGERAPEHPQGPVAPRRLGARPLVRPGPSRACNPAGSTPGTAPGGALGRNAARACAKALDAHRRIAPSGIRQSMPQGKRLCYPLPELPTEPTTNPCLCASDRASPSPSSWPPA